MLLPSSAVPCASLSATQLSSCTVSYLPVPLRYKSGAPASLRCEPCLGQNSTLRCPSNYSLNGNVFSPSLSVTICDITSCVHSHARHALYTSYSGCPYTSVHIHVYLIIPPFVHQYLAEHMYLWGKMHDAVCRYQLPLDGHPVGLVLDRHMYLHLLVPDAHANAVLCVPAALQLH